MRRLLRTMREHPARVPETYRVEQPRLQLRVPCRHLAHRLGSRVEHDELSTTN
jgi:hypothetical protein